MKNNETLKRVVEATERLLNEKYLGRKRLNQNEIWETATLTRDLRDLKEYYE